MAGLACIRASLLSPARASRRDIYIPPASNPAAMPPASLALGVAGLHERLLTGAQQLASPAPNPNPNPTPTPGPGPAPAPNPNPTPYP